MTSSVRSLVLIVVASLFVGSSLISGTWGAAVANADDPLAPIISSVSLFRGSTDCPRLNYSPILEDAAQRYARSERPEDGRPLYDGGTAAFLGSGDPQNAAINSAYARGARGAVTECAYTEFGVGFIRHEDREVDVVTMIFGQPAKVTAAPAPPAPAPAPAPNPVPTQCPVGSPTPNVPFGQTCAPVPPPKDKVSVSFAKGFQWTVTVTSTADIGGACTYAATNPILPGSNKGFDIAARGSAIFTVLAPPPLSTYHVVVSCKGTFNGQTVEFGHVEQDVSS